MGALDLDQVESYVAKQTQVPALNVDSVVIAKCKAGYADEAVDMINQSYAQTVSYIRQYPFGVAKVEGARLYKVDDLVIFIMAGAVADENATEEDAAKLAVSEYEKVDAAIKDLFGSIPQNLAVIPDPNQGGNGGGLIGG